MGARLFLMAAVVLLLGCNKGGSWNPAEPEQPKPDYSGEWRQTARLKRTSCPGAVPEGDTIAVTVLHIGSRVTFVSEDPFAPVQTGVVDMETGEYEAENVVLKTEAGTTTIKESGTFTSDTEYTGTQNFILEYGLGSCFATYRIFATKTLAPSE